MQTKEQKTAVKREWVKQRLLKDPLYYENRNAIQREKDKLSRKIENKQGVRNNIFSLIGNTYGRLTVIAETERLRGRRRWLCKCDCGEHTTPYGDALKSGKTKSCGCLQAEVIKKLFSTHNDSLSKEYISWCKIKERCYNKNSHDYTDYGGRGIIMCDRWLNSYENFLFDMGRSPSPHHTPDRFPNNDGNYEPSNCRWATKKEQANNRRSNVLFTYNGITLNLSQWKEKLRLKNHVFGNARYRGKSIEDIISKNFK